MDAPVEASNLEMLAAGLKVSPLFVASIKPRTKSNDSFEDCEEKSSSGASTELASRKSSVDFDVSGEETVTTETVTTEQTKEKETEEQSVLSQNTADVVKRLVGVWTGEKGETYTVTMKGSLCECVRQDGYCAKKFTIMEDASWNILWWGIQKTYYVCISDLCDRPDEMKWYKARDLPGCRPRFKWHKTEEADWQTEDSKTFDNRGWSAQSHYRQKKWQPSEESQYTEDFEADEKEWSVDGSHAKQGSYWKPPLSKWQPKSDDKQHAEEAAANEKSWSPSTKHHVKSAQHWQAAANEKSWSPSTK